MALGTATIVNDERKTASAPLGFIEMSFAGDASYPGSGGTTGFAAYVQAAVGRNVTPLYVVKAAATGVYTAIYDKANDKLYVENASGAEASGNLSTTTFKLLVAYK